MRERVSEWKRERGRDREKEWMRERGMEKEWESEQSVWRREMEGEGKKLPAGFLSRLFFTQFPSISLTIHFSLQLSSDF